MADQTERAARLLVRALYTATDGERRWWVLPANLNEVTKEAIAVAVDRGWMIWSTAGRSLGARRRGAASERRAIPEVRRRCGKA